MSKSIVEYSYGIPPGHRNVESNKPNKAKCESTNLNTKAFIELAQDKDAEIAEWQSNFLDIARDKALIKLRPREFSRYKRDYKKYLAELQLEKKCFERWEAERQQARVKAYRSYLNALAQAEKDRAQLSDLMLTTLPMEILLQILAHLACQESERSIYNVRPIKQESQKILELLAYFPSIEIRGGHSSLCQLLEPFTQEAILRNIKIGFEPHFPTPTHPYRVPYQPGFDCYLRQIRVLSLHFRGGVVPD
ncbi:hypothetical protein LTR37_001401 [Vermiconidia calcicola]|uniref:Uncharacterized protein n=1 Tax=Vermiconidia calcicola TaxID=1690605 RepID=A0ACC3NVY5_9PEZI|nr:hypothetical protein LTR37_001401 [Vermiconidia calcicola]